MVFSAEASQNHAGAPAPAVDGKHRAFDVVIAELERIIFEDVDVGDSLPSEGELAKSFGVSRLTVREAVRTVETRGLIEISQGRRPTVAAPNGAAIGDFFDNAVRRDPRALLELLDIRQALEVHIAALAATRATRANVEMLDAAISGMAQAGEHPEPFHDADVRFHEALAAATHNRLITLLLESLAAPLRASRIRSYAGHIQRRLPVTTAIDQHRAIADAVRAGNPRAAVAAMRRHLKQTEKEPHRGAAGRSLSRKRQVRLRAC